MMHRIGIPAMTYGALKDFLAKRGVDLELYHFRSSEYARYVKLIDEIIMEGIEAIKEFEEFDRHVTRIEEAKVRIEEAKKRMGVDE